MTFQDLKFSIIQLAMKGKLVEQCINDCKVDITRIKNKTTDEYEFDLPNNWQTVHLESITESISAKQYQILESQVLSSGRFPVISQSKEYSIGFSDDESKLFRHNKPVIVFGDHTTEVKYVDFDFIVGADGIKIFVPLYEKINVKFLLYVLQYYCRNLNKQGGYSRHYKFLKNKPIPIPPLAEQNRIVVKIQEVLPLIEKYGEIATKISILNKEFPDNIRKSILYQAVQGKISSNVKFNDNIEITLNHIYSCKKEEIKNGLVIDKKHTPDVIKDDEIPFEIPNSWKWVKLGDITTFYAGKTPERHNVNYWKNPTTPWVSISDMVSNGIITDTKEKISDLAVKDCLQKCVSPKGTLIMSFKLTIGKVSYLGIDATHNEAIISIFPFAKDDKLEILKNYLFTILPFMANYGDSKNAIKGRTLNATSLTNLYIPLPSFEEQKYIVIKVKDLRKLVDTLN